VILVEPDACQPRAMAKGTLLYSSSTCTDHHLLPPVLQTPPVLQPIRARARRRRGWQGLSNRSSRAARSVELQRSSDTAYDLTEGPDSARLELLIAAHGLLLHPYRADPAHQALGRR